MLHRSTTRAHGSLRGWSIRSVRVPKWGARVKGRSLASRALPWALAVSVAGCVAAVYLAFQLLGLFLPSPMPATPAARAGRSGSSVTPTAFEPMPPTETPEDQLITPSPEPTPPEEPVRLTIVYDNRTLDARLQTAWGFACWIEAGELTLLFDTGADGPTLLGNLAVLGLHPEEIDLVVISHEHADHTGGLHALLEVNDHLSVFVPSGVSGSLQAQARERAMLVVVEGVQEIADGIWSLGPMGTSPVEQSLAIRGRQGLIVVTGCAHPGIVNIARAASDLGPVHLVLGGFHLGGKSAGEIESVISGLRALGVEGVAPCHCTGDLAIRLFETAFGEAFLGTGAGMVLSIPR